MAQLRSSGPYIWVTWAAKLLTGENSCEWAAWFKAQHESWSWEKAPSGFDQAGWMIKHTALVNQLRTEWEDKGYTVTTEGQNSFALRGSAATLAGKPDLIAVRDREAVIIDAKTGKPQPSHSAQVMIYQYAVPKGVERYRGLEFRGKVTYKDHTVEIPPEAVDREFVRSLSTLVQRLGRDGPARRVPSVGECRFCDITKADCPERMEGEPQAGVGTTDDF